MTIACRVREICQHEFTHTNHMVPQIYQPKPNPLISPVHSSKSDGVVTIFLHILLNFNLCCLQWCKSHGASLMSIACRVREICQHEFTHTNQIDEIWLNSGAHSSKSDGDVTLFLHILLNLNLCCIQRCTSHVHSL